MPEKKTKSSESEPTPTAAAATTTTTLVVGEMNQPNTCDGEWSSVNDQALRATDMICKDAPGLVGTPNVRRVIIRRRST